MMAITTSRCNIGVICLLIAASQIITVDSQIAVSRPGKLCVLWPVANEQKLLH